MIRFIDLRGQGTGERFAFYDTITDYFIDAGGMQAWSKFDDFWEWYVSTWGETELRDRDRFASICPYWAFTDGEDDLEPFYKS